MADTFTISENGIYYFCASVSATQKDKDKYISVVMIKNKNQWTPLEMSTDAAYARLNGSCILRCTKGDVFELTLSSNNSKNFESLVRFEVVQLMKI